MFKYYYETLSLAVGLILLFINNYFIIEIFPLAVPYLNLAGGMITVVPPVWIFYIRYKTHKEFEEQFIVFITDITESINSGMTLPLALEHCSKRDYLALTSFVRELSAQVSWGIPFEKALKIFAEKIGSIPINRAVKTIIETYKVGGKIADTLNAIGDSLITIDRIKKERSASVHSQIVTSYMIFFIFIFILVVLQTFLIPALAPISDVDRLGAASLGVQTTTQEDYERSFSLTFINFIIIQGFFAGLVTGKMAEGSVIAGIKHSILLIAIGYTIFSLASQMEIAMF